MISNFKCIIELHSPYEYPYVTILAEFIDKCVECNFAAIFNLSDLNEFYYKIPDDKPIHIARVWDRYSVNEGKKLTI